MREELSVIADGRLVGQVLRTGNRLRFRYAPSWFGSSDAFPLSLSMPLVVEEHDHRTIDAFLRGLTYGLNVSTNLLSEWIHVSNAYETGSADIDSDFESVTNVVPFMTDEGFIGLEIGGSLEP